MSRTEQSSSRNTPSPARVSGTPATSEDLEIEIQSPEQHADYELGPSIVDHTMGESPTQLRRPSGGGLSDETSIRLSPSPGSPISPRSTLRPSTRDDDSPEDLTNHHDQGVDGQRHDSDQVMTDQITDGTNTGTTNSPRSPTFSRDTIDEVMGSTTDDTQPDHIPPPTDPASETTETPVQDGTGPQENGQSHRLRRGLARLNISPRHLTRRMRRRFTREENPAWPADRAGHDSFIRRQLRHVDNLFRTTPRNESR